MSSKWQIIAGSLFFIGVIASACTGDGVAPLTPDEKSELSKIQNSGNFAAPFGYNVTQNINLMTIPDNFGKIRGCVISIRGRSPDIGLVHPSWNLNIQFGEDIPNTVWTINKLSNNAGEVRLTIGDKTYSLDHKANDKGMRSIDLNNNILKNLLASESANALSGMVMGTEFGMDYDLRGFEKAYKFAKEICD